MKIEQKLAEARYFFDEMKRFEIEKDIQKFNFNLSAFLSSARSILQYSREEAKKKKMLTEYDNLIAGNEILRYFKDKRNINIHSEPIVAINNIDLDTLCTLRVSEKVNITFYNENGELLSKDYFDDNKNQEMDTGINKELISHTYKFTDWTGEEDIIELGNLYLEELKNFINKAKLSFLKD